MLRIATCDEGIDRKCTRLCSTQSVLVDDAPLSVLLRRVLHGRSTTRCIKVNQFTGHKDATSEEGPRLDDAPESEQQKGQVG